MDDAGSPDLEALTDAIARRLVERFPGTFPPLREPGLERPPILRDPPQLPDELLPLRRLAIAGVELTQSIQHHGAAGTSYGPDNSVPLVALKTLVARVYPYVRPGVAAPDALSGSRITGELVLSVGDRVVYRTGPTRASGARVGSQADLDRTLWDEEVTGSVPVGSGGPAIRLMHRNPSLNFLVPAWYCRRGRFHLSIRLWRVGTGGQAAPQDSASRSEYIEFLNIRPPRLALVRVNWVDGAGTVNRPSDADVLGTIRLAERMLPFPYFETTILSMEYTRSGAFGMLSPTAGDCNALWNELVGTLALLRFWTALFQLGDIVYGFLPIAAVPTTPGPYNGCCGREAGASFAGNGLSFAHEIGHVFGREHVAVPGDPDNDPNYPNYGGSLRSIGEVGLDTGGPTLYDPSEARDVMAYGTATRPVQWISPYTYMNILEARDTRQSAPADPRRVRPVLLIDVRVHRGVGEERRPVIEVRRAYRVEAAGPVPPRPDGATSPLSLDLLDANRRILATHHCLYVRAKAGDCGCGPRALVPLEREPYYDLQEVIEWPGDEVASIAFHRGEGPLATLEVGEPPTVEVLGPDRREQYLALRVNSDHPRVQPSVAVLFSGDDGATWQPVALDPPEGEVVVEAERLPGGGRCRFRAIATAELRSATADTEPFELPPARRRIHLRLPDDRGGIEPGLVALSAFVDTRGLGAVLPQEIRWHSSLEGDLGAGLEVVAELGEGRHEITVTAPDGRGGTLSERGIIIVSGHPISRGGWPASP